MDVPDELFYLLVEVVKDTTTMGLECNCIDECEGTCTYSMAARAKEELEKLKRGKDQARKAIEKLKKERRAIIYHLSGSRSNGDHTQFVAELVQVDKAIEILTSDLKGESNV